MFVNSLSPPLEAIATLKPIDIQSQILQALLFINFSDSFKLYLINLNMRKSKHKNTPFQSKNHPLNINISFNINPKNILHQDPHSELKYAQNTSAEHFGLLSKNKQTKHKKLQYDNNEFEVSQKTSKRNEIESFPDAQMNKKDLQKIKKKFLNKINNMDITLAGPNIDSKEQKAEDEDKQSLMSAKMVQFENNQVKPSAESLQLNLNGLGAKSKMFTNNEISKVLPVDPMKKGKHQGKLTERKAPLMTQSKYITHFKGYSNFTDVKGSPERYRQKKIRGQNSQYKKAKAKQQNLQEKLQRFKIDMMKLALVYDENQVLKTKLSSEYYNNIRSRQVSKDVVDVQKINEVEQHQKTQQIKSIQANQPSNEMEEKSESQSFKQLKDVYQDYSKKKHNNESRECTKNIVEYYTQITTEPKYAFDEPPQQRSEVSSDSESSSSYSHSHRSKDKKKSQASIQSKNEQQTNLQSFVKFLQKKLSQSSEGGQISKQLNNLLHQYTNKQVQQQPLYLHTPDHPSEQQLLHSTSKIQSPKPLSSDGLLIDCIDHQINKEITSITYLKDDLIQNHHMNGDQIFQLEIWEQNYKNQLLRIKGKMWKEYKTIRNVIQNRITDSNANYNQIKTRKTKKQNKIMKCLSEQLLLKYQPQMNLAQTIEELKMGHQNLPFLQKERGFLIKQEYLSVEPSLSDDNSDEHTDFQITQGEPALITTSCDLINSKISQREREESILMSSLVKIQMQEQRQIQQIKSKLIPLEDYQFTISKKYNLSEQDKQDIFQFIFLDICIELYQQAIDKQQAPQDKGRGYVAADRILKSLKNYVLQQKKRKTDKDKKIGIPTNVNTVKLIVQQINKFILSDIHVNGSLQSNKQRVLEKLNLPLGPSQTEILKSLRLSLYNNQPVDDYEDDIEQADLLVLEPQLFLYFQNQVIKIQELSFSKYYEDEKRDEQRMHFLRNCMHIHQKAIFDCINENLDYHRIYGIWGRPFVWKKNALFHHRITERDLENALSKTTAEVLKCSAFVCGLMVQKEDSLIKDIAGDPNYVRRLQDERIFKLLQNFVLEMQEKWFFHDDEQSQVMIELSHIVWAMLIKQAMKEISEVMK